MNIDLAYAVLDHIIANPGQYTSEIEIAWIDADGYDAAPGAGTLVADFFGWACLLSGDNPVGDLCVVTSQGARCEVGDRALDLLGLTVDVNDGGFCYEDVDTVDKLAAAVGDTFGPRPAAGSGGTR